MSERLYIQFGFAASIAVALLLIGYSELAVAQTVCPAGSSPATAADLPAMQAAGIPSPAVGQCWNQSNPNVGAATAQAKQDLQTMTCNSGVNIQGLDSNFAVCADKFMMQLRQTSPGACINSAYRNPQQQLAACIGICGQSSCPGKCAPPGYSFHQKGLAIDVSYRISNSQAWQIAQSSTNGGIANPTGLHSSDPAHFQATGNSCSGAPVPNTDNTDYYTGPVTSTPQQQQTSGIANTLQRMFAPPQAAAPYAQPAPITPITSSPTTQTSACAPQYICSNGTVYYQSASCTTSTFQICQYGCTGTVCAPAPANATTSVPTSTSATISASSPLGLLQQFITSTIAPTSTHATNTPVSLNSSIYTIVEGVLGGQTQGQSTTSASSSFEGTSGYVQPTLTSNGVGVGNTYSGGSYSPLMSAFVNLRSLLNNLLTYLQPFGGQLPATGE